MICYNCSNDEQPVTSSGTGNTYCPNCAARLGRAFTPPGPMSRQDAILEMIHITRQRLAGTMSRQEHESRVQAIVTREPELRLEFSR